MATIVEYEVVYREEVLRRLDFFYPHWHGFVTSAYSLAAQALVRRGLIEGRRQPDAFQSRHDSRLLSADGWEYRLILPEEEQVLRALGRLGDR